MKKKYIYTNKKHSYRAIMGVILGLISLASLWLVVYFSYQASGDAKTGYGFTGLFSLLFSCTGLGLSAVTVRNKDYYRLFPVMGLVLNFLALAGISLILYAGANL